MLNQMICNLRYWWLFPRMSLCLKYFLSTNWITAYLVMPRWKIFKIFFILILLRKHAVKKREGRRTGNVSIKNPFIEFFAQFYYGHFKLSPRSLPSNMCKRVSFVRFRTKLDLPAPVTGTGGSKGKNSLVPLTSFVPVPK